MLITSFLAVSSQSLPAVWVGSSVFNRACATGKILGQHPISVVACCAIYRGGPLETKAVPKWRVMPFFVCVTCVLIFTPAGIIYDLGMLVLQWHACSAVVCFSAVPWVETLLRGAFSVIWFGCRVSGVVAVLCAMCVLPLIAGVAENRAQYAAEKSIFTAP